MLLNRPCLHLWVAAVAAGTLAACSSSPSSSSRGDAGTASDVVSATDVLALGDSPAVTDIAPGTDTPAASDTPDIDTPGTDVVSVTDTPVVVDAGTPDSSTAIVTYQVNAQRTGTNPNETMLTPAALMAGRFGLDTSFVTSFAGGVYAQPLYLPALTIGGATHDVLFVATQTDSVYALDAASGATLWQTSLGTAVPLASLSCGNIDPSGVIGTPVIDPAAGTLYAVARVVTGHTNGFTLNALDVTTGMPRAGYPVPISPPSTDGQMFSTTNQGQRGALSLINGTIYVTFGGLYGDCTPYHGWVVGIDAATPTAQTLVVTQGQGSGIWGPAGASTDGAGHLFVATGNAFGSTSTTPVPMGESVLRLGIASSGPTFSGTTTDFFAPSNGTTLDNEDLDVGSVAPVVLPGLGGTHLLAQGGKSGVEYLVNADNLGGRGTGNGLTGEAVYSSQVSSSELLGASAAYSDGTHTLLFVPSHGQPRGECPLTGMGVVIALQINVTGSSPNYSVAWCTGAIGNPNPPAVSSNGTSNAILWTASQNEGSSPGAFAAYEVSTGVQLWNATGADMPTHARRYLPPVVADGRVYITGTTAIQMYRLIH